MITLKVKRLCPEAVLPTRAHQTDAGLDIVATSRVFDEDGCATYGTGLAMEIPEGHVGLLFPRSSIAVRDLMLSNSVGVIDSGYRGEVKFKFKPSLLYVDRDGIGHGPDDYKGSDQTDIDTQIVTAHGRHPDMPDVHPNCLPFPPRVYEVGERIGQLIVMPIPYVAVVESDTLGDSERGTGGYGSTGK